MTALIPTFGDRYKTTEIIDIPPTWATSDKLNTVVNNKIVDRIPKDFIFQITTLHSSAHNDRVSVAFSKKDNGVYVLFQLSVHVFNKYFGGKFDKI